MKFSLTTVTSVLLLCMLAMHLNLCFGALPEIRSNSALSSSGRRPIRIRTADAYIYPDESIEDIEVPTVDAGVPLPQFQEQRTGAVAHFMRNSKSKAAVSAVSAVVMALIVHYMCMMLFAASPPIVFWFAALTSAAAVYAHNDYGEFCRAVGVCGLLLARRITLTKFLAKLISQGKAAVGVSERQQFPPCRNPWQYYPTDGEADLQFRMFSTLLSVVLLSAYLGWLVARPVPLLPNWMGALGSAAAVGYATTLTDSTGDLLRYLGYAEAHAAGVLADTAEEVQLRDKAGALLGHAMVLSRRVDSEYKVAQRARYLLADAVTRLTMLVGRVRRDMNGEVGDNDRPPARRRRNGEAGPQGMGQQGQGYYSRPEDISDGGDAPPAAPANWNWDRYATYR